MKRHKFPKGRMLNHLYRGMGTALELVPPRRALLGRPKLTSTPTEAVKRDLIKLSCDWQRVGGYLSQSMQAMAADPETLSTPQ